MEDLCFGGAQFYDGLDTALREGAMGQSLQRMPPGTSPSQATVVLEPTPTERYPRGVLVSVQEQLRYTGPNQAFRSFAEARRQWFHELSALRFWAERTIKQAYAHTPTATRNLTDFGAVRSQLSDAASAAQPTLTTEKLFDALKGSVRGQDVALRALARGVTRHLARPKPSRPFVGFAIGTTGVGKTQTVLALVDALKANGYEGVHFLRLDMSEYSTHADTTKITGGSPSWVGYQDGAALPEALSAHRRCIILLDELEKAHPNVIKIFLGLFDAGRLTVAKPIKGKREIEAKNAIFIATSNAAAEAIVAELEREEAFSNEGTIAKVSRHHLRKAGFAPEFLGRVRTWLAYRPLGGDALSEIAALSIKRVAEEYGITLAYIEPSVVVALLKSSAEESYGARVFQYQADELLGDCFATHASSATPMVLSGPPFTCTPNGVANTP